MYFAKFHIKRVTSFFPKMFTTIFFKYAHQQQPCNDFSRSTSHAFVAQNFRVIFFKAQPYSLKHMTIGRAPLDYRSGQIKALCLTTHNTHNRQISMPSAGIQPTIPPSQRPQSHFLDRAATGIDKFMAISFKKIKF